MCVCVCVYGGVKTEEGEEKKKRRATSGKFQALAQLMWECVCDLVFATY